MPRIRPLTKAEAAPELLPILEQVERTFGVIHAGTGIFAYCPAILQASNALGRAVASSGTVTPLIRALAMLRVAQVAGCPFRIDTTAVAARDAGATDQQVKAVAKFRTQDCFTMHERAALTLAEAMTSTPVEVSDEVFDQARALFSDQQLVELAATIASENYRVRFNRAFAIESIGLYDKPSA
jgi:4-carboxymuconolactone decarboxylase